MISSKGLLCDFCEKRLGRHVTIAVRGMHYGEVDPYRGWGFYEGHRNCWHKERRKWKRAVKAGPITRWR